MEMNAIYVFLKIVYIICEGASMECWRDGNLKLWIYYVFVFFWNILPLYIPSFERFSVLIIMAENGWSTTMLTMITLMMILICSLLTLNIFYWARPEKNFNNKDDFTAISQTHTHTHSLYEQLDEVFNAQTESTLN